MRYVIVAAAFTAVMYGDDITLPLDSGSIVIRAQFIRVNSYGSYVPELNFKLKNQTSSGWRTLKLQFNIGGLCNGASRQWTLPVVTSLGWDSSQEVVNQYTDTVISLVDKVDGCKTEIIKASLILAENAKTRIDGVTGERVDLEKQLQELKAKRDAEAARQAEEERKAAEEQSKKDPADEARRKRLAADQKKKDAEREARMAKERTAEAARAAEERRRVRAACAGIFQNTVDKKVKDLTVGEEQKVRACQALGLYPPR